MVKRTGNAPDTEPEQSSFEKPSEKEHLFQVVDVFDRTFENNKFNLDGDTVVTRLEVVGGNEEGRSMLNRVSLNFDYKGFFATRLFLKAIGLPHKGQFEINTDEWPGMQFYATVKHATDKNDKKKTYANIDQYNFEKLVDQHHIVKEEKPKSEEIAWDE